MAQETEAFPYPGWSLMQYAGAHTECTALAVSTDGKQLAVANRPRITPSILITIWQIGVAKPIAAFDCMPRTYRHYFSHAKALFFTHNNTRLLLHLSNGDLISMLIKEQGFPNEWMGENVSQCALHRSRDGVETAAWVERRGWLRSDRVIVQSGDKKIQYTSPGTVNSITFSRSGDELIIAYPNEIIEWQYDITQSQGPTQPGIRMEKCSMSLLTAALNSPGVFGVKNSQLQNPQAARREGHCVMYWNALHMYSNYTSHSPILAMTLSGNGWYLAVSTAEEIIVLRTDITAQLGKVLSVPLPRVYSHIDLCFIEPQPDERSQYTLAVTAELISGPTLYTGNEGCDYIERQYGPCLIRWG